MVERVERMECMTERMEGLEQRLLAELARHTKAVYESMSTRLEAKVFAPRRR
jgi:hypothetical protein